MRLQKNMARAGVASRRNCENLIKEGRVTVNGQMAMLGADVTETDKIYLDGNPLKIESSKLYFLFYKPRGVVTTLKDPQGRKTVLDYFSSYPRLFPVGRLDLNTEGLLLMTNDGDLANRLTHPSYNFPKTYYAEIEGDLAPNQIAALKSGIMVDTGDICTADNIIVLQNSYKSGCIAVRILLHEGKNREVRRMFNAIGLQVKFLRREKIGNLTLKGLRPGMSRSLTDAEIDYLKKSCKI